MGSQLQQNLANASLRDKWPRRSVRLEMDLLPAFETGDLYDCTIRVGCDLQNSDSTFRDFKCHKVILSGCSPMFETMFFSHFKEAKMGPDEPILLDRLDPDVFESAMKFVYGQVADFKTAAFGNKLYEFAHEMQIDTLKDQLVEFFKQTKSSKIFALFDLYQKTGNKVGLENCKEILEMKTKEALASQDWLNISPDSILEFLNMDCLNMGEADLLRALIRWGNFQLEQQDNGGENLRSKILPGLRRIRFDSLTHHEVAEMCKEELGEVLTADEKCSILMSIITDDWKMMPTDIVSHPNQITRHDPYTFISLPYQEDSPERLSGIAGKTAINFTINMKATLVGVKLITKYIHPSLRAITLSTSLKSKWTVIGTGYADVTSLHRGEIFHKINSTQSLAATTFHRLTFTFAPTSEQLRVYTLPEDKGQSHSDGLVVNIAGVHHKCLVNIVGLVFLK